MFPEKAAALPGDDGVEVLDQANRLFGVISAEEAHRQLLVHVSAMALVFDRLGRLCLGKRPAKAQIYPGRMDLIFHRHVGAGQSREEAARLSLNMILPLGYGPLRNHGVLPACECTGFELISLYRLNLRDDTEALGLSNDSYLFIAEEELRALSGDYRELFTPLVIHAFERGALFRPHGGE